MEWIFDGIGTEILSFIFGLVTGGVTGVVGHKFYINKQIQKAGKKSVQIQSNGINKGNISADKISGDKNSPSGDYISGDKYVTNNPDEFDIRNFSYYSATQIENVIAKGNNTTLRKWCLELIINQKQEYLILQCIKGMDNDKEKYKLLEELSKRNFEDSEYFAMIGNSLSNGVYLTKAIELYISIGKTEYIETAFSLIENNKYIYEVLVMIYEYNKGIFKKLYNNGNCFNNKRYKRKMMDFLKDKEDLK